MPFTRCTKQERELGRHRRRKHHAKRQIDDVIGGVYLRFGHKSESCEIFQDLLLCLQERTDLIRPTPELYRWSDACLYVHGLENLAVHHRDFLRPIHTWRPAKGSQRKTFASLVQHLLIKYPTPAFMTRAWLQPVSAMARRQQAWHIQMSLGASIRRLDIPMRMTRRMEGLFLQAPQHFTIEQAMRYSQVLGLGGDKSLALAVAAARMGTDLKHDDFWESVVRFFIKAKGLKSENVNPIVDFLYHMKFADREVVGEDGIIVLGASQNEVPRVGQSGVRFSPCPCKEYALFSLQNRA